MTSGMSTILIPDLEPGAVATSLPRPGHGNDAIAGVDGLAAGTPDGRTRRVSAAPVVPTDCTTCLSAGSVRRGICDICGTVTVR